MRDEAGGITWFLFGGDGSMEFVSEPLEVGGRKSPLDRLVGELID